MKLTKATMLALVIYYRKRIEIKIMQGKKHIVQSLRKYQIWNYDSPFPEKPVS